MWVKFFTRIVRAECSSYFKSRGYVYGTGIALILSSEQSIVVIKVNSFWNKASYEKIKHYSEFKDSSWQGRVIIIR